MRNLTIAGYTLPELRKAGVAVLAFLLTGVSIALQVGGIIPDGWVRFIALGVNLAAAYGVYRTPNDTWIDVTERELRESDHG